MFLKWKWGLILSLSWRKWKEMVEWLISCISLSWWQDSGVGGRSTLVRNSYKKQNVRKSKCQQNVGSQIFTQDGMIMLNLLGILTRTDYVNNIQIQVSCSKSINQFTSQHNYFTITFYYVCQCFYKFGINQLMYTIYCIHFSF